MIARGAPRLDAPLGGDQRAHIRALHEAHREVQHPVLVARVEDGNHVWVVDRGRHLRLAPKALTEAFFPGVLEGG